MRTIFIRVTNEASPLYASVFASPIASTTFSIDSVHPDFTDASLELGPGVSEAEQRMIAVERIR